MKGKTYFKIEQLDEETALKTWPERFPDISDERVKELTTEVKSTLAGIPEANRIKYLNDFTSWENDKHLISKWLLYYIKDFLNWYNDSAGNPDTRFQNRSISNIQSEINRRGSLEVWKDYKGYIPLTTKNAKGSILLLIELFEIYEALKLDKTAILIKEKVTKRTELENKLGWTGKGNLKEHLIKLNNHGIINYESIDAVLDMKEKIKIVFSGDNRKDYAKSIYVFWAEEDYAKCAKTNPDKKYKQGQGKIFDEIFEDVKRKKFSDYIDIFRPDIKKIIEK